MNWCLFAGELYQTTKRKLTARIQRKRIQTCCLSLWSCPPVCCLVSAPFCQAERSVKLSASLPFTQGRVNMGPSGHAWTVGKWFTSSSGLSCRLAGGDFHRPSYSSHAHKHKHINYTAGTLGVCCFTDKLDTAAGYTCGWQMIHNFSIIDGSPQWCHK